MVPHRWSVAPYGRGTIDAPNTLGQYLVRWPISTGQISNKYATHPSLNRVGVSGHRGHHGDIGSWDTSLKRENSMIPGRRTRAVHAVRPLILCIAGTGCWSRGWCHHVSPPKPDNHLFVGHSKCNIRGRWSVWWRGCL